MAQSSLTDLKTVEYRSIPLVVLLSAVTLFIGYPIYLCYRWASELNAATRQTRHLPQHVLILSIVTLGLAAVIYECVFAYELQQCFRARGRADGRPQLTTWVVALNAVACILSLTGVGLLLAIPCGMAATCLVQAEFNKLAVGAVG